MATNTLLTTDKITREALRLLHEKLTFIRSINRQYDDQFAKSGAKIGSTLRIRKPARYVVTDGATMVAQNSVQEYATLSVTTRKHVGLEFSTQELTMDMDELSKNHLEPAMSVLAAEMEADVIERAIKATFGVTGTWGTPPANLEPFLRARAMLNQQLAPKDQNRHALLSSMMAVPIVEGLKALANDPEQISRQYREGYITRAAGLTWAESESMYAHANGSQTMTGTVATTVATNGSKTLALAGLGISKTVTAGSTFTIAGVYQLHPQTKAVLSSLQQFVVETGGTSDGAGALSVTVSPGMYFTADGRQNISAAPQAAAATTFTGVPSETHEQALVYHRDAFTFASADLILPKTADAHREVYDGISMRIVSDYDIVDDEMPTRIDVLYGFAALRPEHSVRVTS